MSVIRVNDALLSVEEAGHGPAVVFAHGGGGDLSQWRHQIPVFARQYRVIAFDARGHGGSSLGNGASGIGTFVSDLQTLLRHLEIRQAHFVGATLGGVTVLELALAHPEMARTLVLVSTAPDTTEEMRSRFAASAAIIESGDLDGFAEGFVHFIFSADYVAGHRDEVADFRRRLARVDPVGYARAIGALANRPDLTPRLRTLAVPSLIVTGELDPIPTSATGAALLGRSLPNSRAEVVSGAAHLPQIEQPQIFNRLVLDFLRVDGRAQPIGVSEDGR